MYGLPFPPISQPHDRYGFIDEREIRIATGITLILGMLSFFLVLFKWAYDIPLILTGIMFLDFLLRILISPHFSLFWSFVRMFLKKNDAIWVWTIQKRFAWTIGAILSGFTLYCIILLGGYTGYVNPDIQNIWNTTAQNIAHGSLVVVPMNPAIFACTLCIIFMWLESVVGYCVWCHIYRWLVKKWWTRRYEWQNCINGTCTL